MAEKWGDEHVSYPAHLLSKCVSINRIDNPWLSTWSYPRFYKCFPSFHWLEMEVNLGARVENTQSAYTTPVRSLDILSIYGDGEHNSIIMTRYETLMHRFFGKPIDRPTETACSMDGSAANRSFIRKPATHET